MSVMTQSANFAQAIRKVKDREISYRWYSPSQSIQFEGELVGGMVSLNISHDASRKRFTAFIQFAHYAKALDQFDAQVVELLSANVTAIIANDAVRQAWNRATLIAMGGDGTHGA